MVTSVKKGPRSRKLGYPMAPETRVARAPPITIPNQGEIPTSMNSRVEVYAPMPKKAAWPSESCPAKPPTMFQAELMEA
jgi:hypothetical protein